MLPEIQDEPKDMDKASRPKFLYLLKIRLPVPGVVSISHRISGVFLFLAVPLYIFLLHISLRDPAGFDAARSFLQMYPGRLVLLFSLWLLIHHLIAGVRFLLLDIGLGKDRPADRASSWLVLVTSLVALITLAMWILT